MDRQDTELTEDVMQSLDKSDTEIERVWTEEAVRRVRACDEGRMKIILKTSVGHKECAAMSVSGKAQRRGMVIPFQGVATQPGALRAVQSAV